MAQVKISNLPVAAEIWNLNEVLPVVNSGSTVTSKRTYGSLFSNHSGGTYTITSTDQTYAIIACGSSSPQTHIRVGGINNAAVISSRGANITSGQMNTIIGSEQNSDSDQPTINGGQYNTIIGSKGGVSTSGNHQFISNSLNGIIYGGEYNTLMGTQGFYLGPNSAKCAGIGVEAGGWDGPRYAFAGGGYQLSTVNDGGNQKAALAYENLTFDGTNKGNFLYHSAGMAVLNGTIEHDEAALIASSGGVTLYDQTLHTDNIHTFKTETFTEVNGGNVGGAINVDCSTGSFFLFTMTADTTPNFINVRNGQRFFFIVYNNGTWAVPTATVNGVPGTVMAKNGSINPQNNSYSKYTATYDGVNGLLFLDEELGFAAV